MIVCLIKRKEQPTSELTIQWWVVLFEWIIATDLFLSNFTVKMKIAVYSAVNTIKDTVFDGR